MGDQTLFLYRPGQGSILYSTRAFLLPDGGYRRKEGTWVEETTGAHFNPATGQFEGVPDSLKLNRFDTFWYNWSLANPGTKLLR